jgi:hypothetical protein
MSGEVSYFSRFFVKFVEISAAGLASAISAYLLAASRGAPVILSHASFRAGTDRCSGRSDRQRGRREAAHPADLASCGRCRQQAEPCAAAGYRCSRRAARACREGREGIAAAQAHKDRYERGREGASRPEIGGSPGPHLPMSTPIGRHQMTR